MAQVKEQIKTAEKRTKNGGKQFIRCGVKNTGYKAVQGN